MSATRGRTSALQRIAGPSDHTPQRRDYRGVAAADMAHAYGISHSWSCQLPGWNSGRLMFGLSRVRLRPPLLSFDHAFCLLQMGDLTRLVVVARASYHSALERLVRSVRRRGPKFYLLHCVSPGPIGARCSTTI